MSLPGRNDPCPCGSGRKYKNCCLRSTEPQATAFTTTERRSAFAKLVRYAEGEAFKEARELALRVFWAARLETAPEESRNHLQGDPNILAAFLQWFVYDFDRIDDSDATVAARFLSRGGPLGDGERTYLERMSASSLRLYEVVDVRVDEGLTLLDLWNKQEVRIRERLATHQIVKWDLVGARLVDGPDGIREIDGLPYLFQADLKSTLVEEQRRQWRAAGGGPRRDADGFFKRTGVPLLHHLWLDLVALRPLPEIRTTDGEALVPSTVVFDVVDRAAVIAGLDAHGELESDDGAWVWLDQQKTGRILGSVSLKERLTLEVMSEERAERGRRMLEAALGPAVRNRATKIEHVDLTGRSGAKERSRKSGIPADVERQVVTQYLEQHYRKWVDDALPALGGRTPRQSARLALQRPKVVELVKKLEVGMARARRDGKPAVDLGWMWKELGLDQSAGGA